MYSEGLMDLMEMIMILPFVPDVKEKLENIESKATTRYLPVFEKVTVLLFKKYSGRENTQLWPFLENLGKCFPPICSGF